MKELVMVSAIVVATSMLFLVYKMYKNNVYYNNQFKRVDQQMKELTNSMIQMNKVNTEINNKSNAEPNIYSNLKSEYENYTKKFQNEYQFAEQSEEVLSGSDDKLPTELKEQIDNMTLENSQHTLQEQSSQQEFSETHNQEAQLEESVQPITNESISDDVLGDEIKDQITNYLNTQELSNQSVDIEQEESSNFNEPSVSNDSDKLNVNISVNPLHLEELNVEQLPSEELNVEQLPSEELNDNTEITNKNEENSLVNNISEEEKIKIKTYNNYSLESLEKLSIKELQNIARNNKLKIKGRKDELIERVKTLYNLNQNLY